MLASLAGDIVIDDQYTLYVDGDLTIRNNIRYPNTTFGSIADIPQFRVVVRGNIYIDDDVEHLEGTYIAIPNDDGAGNPIDGAVYTCAPVIGAAPTQSQLENICVNADQLRFFGAVVANRIFLHRLDGTTNNAATRPDYNQAPDNSLNIDVAGEVFIESPLHWLVLPFDDGSTSGSGPGEESITDYPPIL